MNLKDRLLNKSCYMQNYCPFVFCVFFILTTGMVYFELGINLCVIFVRKYRHFIYELTF